MILSLFVNASAFSDEGVEPNCEPAVQSDAHIDQLMKRVQQHDKQAFEELIASISERMYRRALMLLHNEHDARDIVQDMSIMIWLHSAKWKGTRALGWILLSLQYQSISKLRRANILRAVEIDSSNEPESPVASDRELLNERFNALMTAMNDLSPTLRESIILYYFEGKTLEEIASRTGVVPGTVSRRITFARKRLGFLLQEDDNR